MFLAVVVVANSDVLGGLVVDDGALVRAKRHAMLPLMGLVCPGLLLTCIKE